MHGGQPCRPGGRSGSGRRIDDHDLAHGFDPPAGDHARPPVTPARGSLGPAQRRSQRLTGLGEAGPADGPVWSSRRQSGSGSRRTSCRSMGQGCPGGVAQLRAAERAMRGAVRRRSEAKKGNLSASTPGRHQRPTGRRARRRGPRSSSRASSWWRVMICMPHRQPLERLDRDRDRRVAGDVGRDGEGAVVLRARRSARPHGCSA